MAEPSRERRKKATINILLAITAVAACVVIAMISLQPTTYDITQGGIAPETITAPDDFVDEAATQRLIEEEQAKVGPVYKTDTEISQQVIRTLENDFAGLEEARAAAQQRWADEQTAIQASVQQGIDDATTENASPPAQPSAGGTAAASPEPSPTPTPYAIPAFDAHSVEWTQFLTEQDIEAMQELAPAYLSGTDMPVLAAMTADEIESIKNTTSKLVQQELYTGISADEAEGAAADLTSETARQLRLSMDQENMIAVMLENDLRANLVFDEQKTQEARDDIAAQVEPVEYKKGQNIVMRGDIVTADQYELLKDLGLLASETTSVRPYLAVIIYIVMVFVIYAIFLAVFNRKLLMKTRQVAILAILTVLAYGLTTVAQLVAVNLFPVFLCVILAAVLISPKNALIYSVFLALLLISVTVNGHEMISRPSLILLLKTVTGGIVAVCVLKDMRYRSRLILAGLAAAVPGVAIEIITWLMHIVNTDQMLFSVAVMAGGGLLCGVAAIGLLPIMESAFKMTTPTKLLELSDPTHPLLKRLMLEAPGTYHHSILVANLAEAGCNAVGGYSLLARVGAYFHDVGKTENPMFFKENQRSNVNPHNRLRPAQSAQIVMQHVPDGVELLKKYKVPEEIVRIAAEHHGNSLVGYFYAMALEEGKPVDAALYRYGGQPPTLKEGAIVMLADVVEAAVRSLDNPSKEQIEETVNKLIAGRYDDGQLDNAPLNRSDLNKIAEAFINVFTGVYHLRVKYPEIKIHGAEDEDRIL